MSPDSDDLDMVRGCLAGSETSYRQLVARYQRPVFSLAMRVLRQAEDAEDVVQETFVRVFRALDRYDQTRSFPTWLFTIAARLCIDQLRRRRLKTFSLSGKDPESDEDRVIELEDPGPGPEEVVAGWEDETRVRALVDVLPPHYRIVVELRHQQDLSYEEIADALGLPLGTVKARIHRARALLKKHLEARMEGRDT